MVYTPQNRRATRHAVRVPSSSINLAAALPTIVGTQSRIAHAQSSVASTQHSAQARPGSFMAARPSENAPQTTRHRKDARDDDDETPSTGTNGCTPVTLSFHLVNRFD
jgi:hypothetical protein